MKELNSEIKPYYGRINKLNNSNPFIQQLISDIIITTEDIIKISNNNNNNNDNNHEWNNLKNSLNIIMNKIVENKLNCEYYKLRIFKNAILPYIKKMKTRIILSKKRFSQINFLIAILCNNNNNSGSNNNNESIDHPANTLLDIENVISSIKQEKNWFQSEFEIDLERAVSLEWLPILTDNRKLLQNIGGRLLIIGLIGIFRYTLFLLPIMMLIVETILIIRKISEKSGLNNQNILQLAKVTLLLVATGIIIKLVEMLPGFGYSVLSFGSILLIISVIDPLLKMICPYLATNITQISSIVNQLEIFEGAFITHMSSLLKDISSNSSINNITRNQNNIQDNNINNNNRVEELSPNRFINQTYNQNTNSEQYQQMYQEEEEEEIPIRPLSTGMRRRKN